MKYFEFGTEHPELMVMLHGGGTSYYGMMPTAKEMAKVGIRYFRKRHQSEGKQGAVPGGGGADSGK